MAINWSLYETRLNINGTTKRDRDLKCLQNKITNNLPNSLSCKAVKINGLDGYLNFTETTKGYDIQSLPNETFSVGDYVLYKTLTYLITEVNGDSELYTKGTMQLTNYTLKFQSPTGTILSYPCIDTTNSSAGISEGKIISTGDAIHTIKVPFDANIMTLKEGRRMYISRDTINPRSYKITKVNDTEYAYGNKGLIEFTLEQTVTGETDDRPDLGICNYFEPIVEPVVPVGEYIMTISTNGDLIMGNPSERTFTPKLIDPTGIEKSFIAVWTFNYNGMPTSDFTITYDGNKCLIKVKENWDIIGNIIELTCTTSDGFYYVSRSATITI